MDIELTPVQAPEVEAAIAAALAPDGPSEADPWWRAGLEAAHET